MIKHPRNHEKESEAEKDGKKVMNGNGGTLPAEDAGSAEAEFQAKQPDDVKSLRDALKAKDEEFSRKKEELDSLKELMMRRQADFDNYKKRMVKSQEEYRKLAIRDLSVDIIQINDDILRAIEAAACVNAEQLPASHSAFIDGVSMISRRMEEMLKKYGVLEIDSLNREFDPCMNEAVEITESEEVDHDTITKVYQKGFVLDEYVVRTARVRVTRPARNRQAPASEIGGDGCRDQGPEEMKS